MKRPQINRPAITAVSSYGRKRRTASGRIIAAKVEERMEERPETRENFSTWPPLSSSPDDMRIRLCGRFSLGPVFAQKSDDLRQGCALCAARRLIETYSRLWFSFKGEVNGRFCKKRKKKKKERRNTARKLPYRYWVLPPREEKATATAARSKLNC